jgi:hypothetical protein
VRRPLRAALALGALLLATGCIPRLSDPFFAFRDLGAPEARPGESLVFGTIEIESSLFGPGDVATVILKRVRPVQDEIQRVASERLPFRAFRARQVKDGHFLVALEPGAYELHRILFDDWTGSEMELDEDGKRATRFTVTRPGVVDLGLLHLAPAPGLAAYAMTARPSTDPKRAAQLRAAIAGTPWERLQPRGAFR